MIKDWSRNWYDSLQVTLDRKFRTGFAYVVSYTWSKSLSLGGEDGFGGKTRIPHQIPARQRCNWPEPKPDFFIWVCIRVSIRPRAEGAGGQPSHRCGDR